MDSKVIAEVVETFGDSLSRSNLGEFRCPLPVASAIVSVSRQSGCFVGSLRIAARGFLVSCKSFPNFSQKKLEHTRDKKSLRPSYRQIEA